MRILRTILSFVILVIIAVGGIFVYRNCASNSSTKSVIVAHAESSEEYSDPLTDLCLDSSFDPEAYPINNDDNSINVIQIAESKDGEFLLYVYVPNQDKNFRATSVNISTAINESLKYHNYMLTFLSSNGVFHKYVVNDFELKPDALRYYSISSIFRAFDKDVDTNAFEGNGNTISEVSYGVEKLYTASTVAGVVSYSCVYSETVLITAKYPGMCRYNNGWAWILDNKTDSHYVAFSADHDIDRLMEADVEFVGQEVTFQVTDGIFKDTYRDFKDHVTLLDDQNGTNDPKFAFGKKYEWKRIQSAKDFLADPQNDLKDDAKKAVSGMQWVLRFYETKFESVSGAGISYYNQTIISDVTILRLKFETDGKVYNLGVVDNKQTGSNIPDNKNTDETTVTDFIKKVEAFFDKIGNFFKKVGSFFSKVWSFCVKHWKLIVTIVAIFLLIGLIVFIRSFFT